MKLKLNMRELSVFNQTVVIGFFNILMILSLAGTVYFFSSSSQKVLVTDSQKQSTFVAEINKLTMSVVELKSLYQVISATKADDALKYLVEIKGAQKEIHELTNKLSKNEDMSDDIKKEFERLNVLIDEVVSSGQEMNANFLSEDLSGAAKSKQELDKNIDNAFMLLSKVSESVRLDNTEFLQDKLKSDNKFIFALAMIFMFAAVGFSFYAAVNIKKSLSAIVDKFKMLSEENKEISEKLFLYSIQVNDNTRKQADSILDTVSVLSEITGMAQKNATSASQSSENLALGQKIVQQGQKTVIEMNKSITDVRSSIDLILSQVERSNKDLDGIVAIMKAISERTSVINDIVIQTKLLSFNASIEAARAGESGKGFSVVASEIAKLAILSGDAAKDIDETLNTNLKHVSKIAAEMKSAVSSLVDDCASKVTNGKMQAERCRDVLEQIVRTVESIQATANQISLASTEQAAGVKGINRSMDDINIASTETRKTAEHSKMAAESLSELTANLKYNIFDLEKKLIGTNHETDVSDVA